MRKRKRLPIRWARKLLKRQDGKCSVAGCDTVLILGPQGQHVNWIDEHILPRALGGKDTLKNRELRCWKCAKTKTLVSRYGSLDSDMRLINKVRSIKNKTVKRSKREKNASSYAWPKGRKMPSRPFPKRRMSLRP